MSHRDVFESVAFVLFLHCFQVLIVFARFLEFGTDFCFDSITFFKNRIRISFGIELWVFFRRFFCFQIESSPSVNHAKSNFANDTVS